MPHELIHYTAVVILRGDNVIFEIHSSSPWKVIGKLEGMSPERQIYKRRDEAKQMVDTKSPFVGGKDIFQNNTCE